MCQTSIFLPIKLTMCGDGKREAAGGLIQRENTMALQFIIGGSVNIINIIIHALVTPSAVGIARSAVIRNVDRPKLHLMAVMVRTALALMVAHTLEIFVWASAYAIVGAAPAGSDMLYFAFVN